MKARSSITALAAVLVAGGMSAFALSPVANAAGPAAGPDCTLEPTTATVTRTLGNRSYRLNVPSGLNDGAAPLLLSLHGFGSSASQVETFTGWTPFAAERGFIVAYPQGQPSSWSGAWDPYTSASPDVSYLRSVVEDVSAEWCVDPSRVHIDGWSNGAVMSQRMACSAPDVFASAVSYGGGTPTLAGFATPCSPSRPISVGLFAGQFDFTYLGLAQNTSEWRSVNACSTNPARTTDAHGRTDTYQCAQGSSVVSRVVNATSHNWPSGARGADQRDRMWAFLSAHPRP